MVWVYTCACRVIRIHGCMCTRVGMWVYVHGCVQCVLGWGWVVYAHVHGVCTHGPTCVCVCVCKYVAVYRCALQRCGYVCV